MPRRWTPEEKYKDSLLKQHNALEEFAGREIEWAEDLIFWYGLNKRDMPVDEYRACAFFKNREYLNKPGSLSLLYKAFHKCCEELPSVTRENAFDILRFRYRMYAEVLKAGGFDGRTDW